MVTAADGLAYAAAQAARVGWYFGQYLATARLSVSSLPRPKPGARGPRQDELLRELRALMARDWDNIRAGYYRMPHDLAPPAGRLMADAVRYFRDLPQVNRRRRTGANIDVRRAPPDAAKGKPPYYLQNFHFQTDGYLSAESARLYDQQVETLFGGGADAMRRQGLVHIYYALRDRRADRVTLLDVGCGTGRFLTFALDNYPRLNAIALDLSRPYLAEARSRLKRYPNVTFLEAAAEAMPLADASVDIIACVYLFHELPRKVRVQVAREFARVLRPGGRLIFIDSLQRGDRTEFEGLLTYFPQAFYEPYYDDYTQHDLIALFDGVGLRLGALDLAFLSKVMLLEKPVPA